MYAVTNEIYQNFIDNNHRWRFTDDNEVEFRAIPTKDDIDKCLDTWGETLASNGGGWIESGGILMKQDAEEDIIDVYVHVGTINKENNNA